MKLPKKLTALLACLAMLVVGFTGMVPERAAASTMLDTRVFGDNMGEPDEPGGRFHFFDYFQYFSQPLVGITVRILSTAPPEKTTAHLVKDSRQASTRMIKIEK